MSAFQDAFVGPGIELQLTIEDQAVLHADIVADQEALAREGARTDTPSPAAALEPASVGESAGQLNLFAVAELIAARAATPSTRKQYATVYRGFGDWLARELGRPPVVEDLGVDAIAAYARHLETSGGRGGGPAAPATRRVYLSLLRALAREIGLEDVANGVRVPQHSAGPPETITDTDYANLLRLPDRRSQIGKRDYALLRMLGDCGLRSAELRGLGAGDLRRPRANSRHWKLYVRGKGGTEREVPIAQDTQAALEAWIAVHPRARGRAGLLDEDPLFVRLGRHRGSEDPDALSAQLVHKLVHQAGLAAGIPARLAHPHALRSYWATGLLEDGVPIHTVSARLGHADLRTTGRYAVDRPEDRDDVADVLDRRHQTARRARGGQA